MVDKANVISICFKYSLNNSMLCDYIKYTSIFLHPGPDSKTLIMAGGIGGSVAVMDSSTTVNQDKL